MDYPTFGEWVASAIGLAVSLFLLYGVITHGDGQYDEPW